MNHTEFNENYYQIVERALRFHDKARREGLLSLEDIIDAKKADERDVFEYGMRFAVDGVDAAVIDIILSNIVNQDQDEQSCLLKTIQKEAVLSIQAGNNGRIMFAVLNSLTGLSLNKDKMKARLEEVYG
jgi:flagellar motor component MotA